jgi:hypothetical protein
LEELGPNISKLTTVKALATLRTSRPSWTALLEELGLSIALFGAPEHGLQRLRGYFAARSHLSASPYVGEQGGAHAALRQMGLEVAAMLEPAASSRRATSTTSRSCARGPEHALLGWSCTLIVFYVFGGRLSQYEGIMRAMDVMTGGSACS